jgi:hypothetical protein
MDMVPIGVELGINNSTLRVARLRNALCLLLAWPLQVKFKAKFLADVLAHHVLL